MDVEEARGPACDAERVDRAARNEDKRSLAQLENFVVDEELDFSVENVVGLVGMVMDVRPVRKSLRQLSLEDAVTAAS